MSDEAQWVAPVESILSTGAAQPQEACPPFSGGVAALQPQPSMKNGLSSRIGCGKFFRPVVDDSPRCRRRSVRPLARSFAGREPVDDSPSPRPREAPAPLGFSSCEADQDKKDTQPSIRDRTAAPNGEREVRPRKFHAKETPPFTLTRLDGGGAIGSWLGPGSSPGCLVHLNTA